MSSLWPTATSSPALMAWLCISVRGTPLTQQTVITCMETLNKNVEGDRAVSRWASGIGRGGVTAC